METKARYTLIGAFTLAVLFGCYTFLYWLENAGLEAWALEAPTHP